MFDAKSLLGTLLAAGVTRSTHSRVSSALGGSGLGDTVGRVLNEAKSGNPLAVGGLGALAGAVLGGGKGNVVHGAIGGGALAILGKLALDALQQRQAGGQAAGSTASVSAGTGQAGATVAVPDEEANARLLLQAMLSAAKADGQIDGSEMQRILGKLDEAGADAASKSFLVDEMRKPLDIAALAQRATSPQLAAQVYAASLLAIEVDTDAERDYLRQLAQALGLDQTVVDRLHASLNAPASTQ